MEKKVYELTISEVLEHVMPPLQEMELKLLTDSLLSEGCRDPLVVWNGIIVDGHNRYRICREYQIPFNYIEMNFANRAEAIAWIIKNQIGRRNLTQFQRCEMVLPYEAELKADAKKRQGKRNDLLGYERSRGRCTADVLADLAAVSHGTLSKVKNILATGDAETLRRVRKGEISIHFAYSSLISKPSMPSDRQSDKQSALAPVQADSIPAVALQPIGDAVRDLLTLVCAGEATTKMIVSELEKVTEMIDTAGGR